MTYDELLAENARLRAENAQLQAESAHLRAEGTSLKQLLAEVEQRVAALEAALKEALGQLEAARRAGKRQAAPFSRGRRKDNPKRPGRKKGHPPAHRAKPEKVDRVLEARLHRSTCLNCGEELPAPTIRVQYQVDIPPVEPVVTQFNVEVARCPHCGQRAQGRHPEQTSDALGAAAVQLGPRTQGLAAEMKHAYGVPYRKTAAVLERGLGLKAAPSALARAGPRLADKAEPTYQQLILAVRGSAVVYGDETGWKLGGDNAWLWVFTTDAVTVYTIDRRRAHEVAERILGRDFPGVLECDCFLAYDPLPYRQQKCLGHLQRRCRAIQEEPRPAEAHALSRRVAALLRGAVRLARRRADLPAERYGRACTRLEAALDRLLAAAPSDEAAARLLKLLRKQRQRLFTFLYVAGVAPTNNAAERAIRPAVVVRKISAGNKGLAGARAHAIITSLWQTCRQQGQDFLGIVTALLRSPQPQAIPLVVEVQATGPPESETNFHLPAFIGGVRQPSTVDV